MAASPCSSATTSRAWSIRTYRQDEDFYYLTGWNEPGAALIVADASPARAGKPALPYREVLLLPERNLRTELFTGVKLDAASPNVTGITGVREVRSIRDLPSILASAASDAVWTQLDSEPAKAALAFTASSAGQRRPGHPARRPRADQNASLLQGPGRDRPAAQSRRRLHQSAGGCDPGHPSRRQ